MIRSKIRKINPERSNKMIYAVAAGVLLLLALFALVILKGNRVSSRSMQETLAYLKNTEGLREVRPLEAERKALIVYSSDSKNAANFETVAHYAAIRLARYWPDCDVLLARNSAEQIVFQVHVRNGVITAEERAAGTPSP